MRFRSRSFNSSSVNSFVLRAGLVGSGGIADEQWSKRLDYSEWSSSSSGIYFHAPNMPVFILSPNFLPTMSIKFRCEQKLSAFAQLPLSASQPPLPSSELFIAISHPLEGRLEWASRSNSLVSLRQGSNLSHFNFHHFIVLGVQPCCAKFKFTNNLIIFINTVELDKCQGRASHRGCVSIPSAIRTCARTVRRKHGLLLRRLRLGPHIIERA